MMITIYCKALCKFKEKTRKSAATFVLDCITSSAYDESLSGDVQVVIGSYVVTSNLVFMVLS